MSMIEAFILAYSLGATGNLAFAFYVSGELPSNRKMWITEAVVSLFPTLLIFAALMFFGVVESARVAASG
jgi:hypothetical protein